MTRGHGGARVQTTQSPVLGRYRRFPGGCCHHETPANKEKGARFLSSACQQRQACFYRHVPACSSQVWTLQSLQIFLPLMVGSEGLGPVTDPGSSLCPQSSQNQVSILQLGTDGWVMLQPRASPCQCLHSPHRRTAGCQSPRAEGHCESRGALFLSEDTLSAGLPTLLQRG